jgi:hypothetical protein
VERIVLGIIRTLRRWSNELSEEIRHCSDAVDPLVKDHVTIQQGIC